MKSSLMDGKKVVREILEKLPAHATLEDIQYHIHVRQRLERRMRDLPRARMLSQSVVERRMERWLGK